MKFTLGRFPWGYRHYDGDLHAGSLLRMLVGITPVREGRLQRRSPAMMKLQQRLQTIPSEVIGLG